ncbi:hypothetical protein SLNSH_15135 [Alsobacter soli]|uniref:Uncharacterized protein n=1 Tax=Alsobacter soli TaxID=2109933 RepID=A0A2T1HR42_9HYPH|nr:hypothetical protein SLNSH_15135 [Alsobacter soli]
MVWICRLRSRKFASSNGTRARWPSRTAARADRYVAKVTPPPNRQKCSRLATLVEVRAGSSESPFVAQYMSSTRRIVAASSRMAIGWAKISAMLTTPRPISGCSGLAKAKLALAPCHWICTPPSGESENETPTSTSPSCTAGTTSAGAMTCRSNTTCGRSFRKAWITSGTTLFAMPSVAAMRTMPRLAPLSSRISLTICSLSSAARWA